VTQCRFRGGKPRRFWPGWSLILRGTVEGQSEEVAGLFGRTEKYCSGWLLWEKNTVLVGCEQWFREWRNKSAEHALHCIALHCMQLLGPWPLSASGVDYVFIKGTCTDRVLRACAVFVFPFFCDEHIRYTSMTSSSIEMAKIYLNTTPN